MNTQRVTQGLPEIKKPSDHLCGGCAQGKMTVAPFPKESQTKTTRPLELIHTDVVGPMRTKSAGGSRYVLTFVDDFSKFVKVYFFRNKSQVYTKFIEYKREMENLCGTKILRIRSDNGGEYISKRFKALCRRLGIIHQKTIPTHVTNCVSPIARITPATTASYRMVSCGRVGVTMIAVRSDRATMMTTTGTKSHSSPVTLQRRTDRPLLAMKKSNGARPLIWNLQRTSATGRGPR